MKTAVPDQSRDGCDYVPGMGNGLVVKVHYGLGSRKRYTISDRPVLSMETMRIMDLPKEIHRAYRGFVCLHRRILTAAYFHILIKREAMEKFLLDCSVI